MALGSDPCCVQLCELGPSHFSETLLSSDSICGIMTQSPVGPPCWMVTKLASGVASPAWCGPGLGGSCLQNLYLHRASFFRMLGINKFSRSPWSHAKRTTRPWAQEGNRYRPCLPIVRLDSIFKVSLQSKGKEAGGSGRPGVCPRPPSGSPLGPAFFCGILRRDTPAQEIHPEPPRLPHHILPRSSDVPV